MAITCLVSLWIARRTIAKAPWPTWRLIWNSLRLRGCSSGFFSRRESIKVRNYLSCWSCCLAANSAYFYFWMGSRFVPILETGCWPSWPMNWGCSWLTCLRKPAADVTLAVLSSVPLALVLIFRRIWDLVLGAEIMFVLSGAGRLTKLPLPFVKFSSVLL